MALDGGTAEVRVIANGAGLAQSIGTETQKGVQGSLTSLRSAGQLLGVTLGAAAAFSFGKEVLAAGNEVLQSNQRLAQAALKDTAVNVAAVTDEFARFGLAAAIDDEKLKDLASRLLQMGFKGSTSELIAETEAIINLGAATGKSESIITRFFVALNSGNVTKAVTSAKTLGLITQQQADHYTAMAKAGRAAEVQQLLTARAEDTAAGAAEAQATAMDKVVNSWNEFKDTIGVQLLGLLTELGTDIGNIVRNLNQLGDALSTSGNAGGLFSQFLKKALIDFNPFVLIVKATNVALDGLVTGLEKVGVIDTSVTVATHEFTAAELKLLDAVKPIPTALDQQAAASKRAKEATKELLKTALGDFNLMADGLTNVKKAWDLTAQAAVRATGIIAQHQKTIARDLKELGDLKIGEGIRNQLIALGPDMVHAFIQGTPKQRAAIKQNLSTILDATRETNQQLKDIMRTGGQQAGKSLTDGVVSGIASGTGQAVAAANSLGNNVIQALRDSMGIHSPSTVGIEIGHNLMDAMIQGMQERFRKVETSLQNLIPLMRKAIGEGAADQAHTFLRELDALDKKFGRLKDRISGFHTGIRGAFADFADLMGGIGAQLEQFRQDQAAFLAQGPDGTLVAPTAPNIGATIASQVGQAQLLAQLLKQLQQSGLSTANLASLAGQGAGAIPIAQALLGDPALIQQLNEAQQQIADITQTTADKLTAAAFGDKVERMGNQLDKLLEDLNAFQEGLHVPELTDATRDFINQLRRLNDALASLGIGGGGGGNTGAAVRDSLLTLKRRNVTTGL